MHFNRENLKKNDWQLFDKNLASITSSDRKWVSINFRAIPNESYAMQFGNWKKTIEIIVRYRKRFCMNELISRLWTGVARMKKRQKSYNQREMCCESHGTVLAQLSSQSISIHRMTHCINWRKLWMNERTHKHRTFHSHPEMRVDLMCVYQMSYNTNECRSMCIALENWIEAVTRLMAYELRAHTQTHTQPERVRENDGNKWTRWIFPTRIL